MIPGSGDVLIFGGFGGRHNNTSLTLIHICTHTCMSVDVTRVTNENIIRNWFNNIHCKNLICVTHSKTAHEYFRTLYHRLNNCNDKAVIN